MIRKTLSLLLISQALFLLSLKAQVTDIDGNTYNTVVIGTQEWMAENLKTTRYANGDNIGEVTDAGTWVALTTGAYCWYNNDFATYGGTYGALYNFYAVADSRNICPTGWHVPSDAEWFTIENYVDPTINEPDATGWRGTDAGTKLKATTGWYNDGYGTDSYGFSAFPVGYRWDDGTFFDYIGNDGYWWSSTENGSGHAYFQYMNYSHPGVLRYYYAKQNGFSVRCVKNDINYGLVADYPFNGNANDESGNGNNGTVNGATPTTDRFGNENSAFLFDGVDDYIQGISFGTNLPTGANPITVSAWILNTGGTDNGGGGINIYHYGQNSSAGMSYHLTLDVNTKISSFGTGYGGFSVSSVTSVDPSWHFVTAIYEGTTTNRIKIYIDGVFDNELTTEYVPNITLTDIWQIGRFMDQNGYFGGKIDDIRVYNRALSESEISDLYHEGGWSSLNEGLVAHYPFNGNANDESGNGNNGTENNGVTITLDRLGNASSAYSFDGIDDYISTVGQPVPTGGNEYSISLWFNVNTITKAQLFLSQWTYANSSNSFYVGLFNGYLRFTDSWPEILVNDALTTNNWIHLVAISTTDNAYIYINGILCATAGSQLIYTGVGPLIIGRQGEYAEEYLSGVLDDIKIYNRALSETEISQLYANYSAPQTLVVLPGNEEITLKWSSERISEISQYDIYQDGVNVGTVDVTTVNDTVYTVTGLTNHQNYEFYVTSTDIYSNVSQPSYTVLKAPSATTVTDIDGNTYPTVTIGTQEWMAENLKTTRYANGDNIGEVTDVGTWAALTNGAYCWYNNDFPSYGGTYGALYNWYAATDSRNVCPTGWHLPNDAEWTTLTDYVGASVAGTKLKATSGWNSDGNGTDEYGFSALPGGYNGGAYGSVGDNGYWWSSTEYDAPYAWLRYMLYNYVDVTRAFNDKRYGYSVRCVKNEAGNSLVAHYTFDGNANDMSGNGNDGTLVGGVTSAPGRFGEENRAYSFNGTDSYITTGQSVGLTNAFTFTAWIYPQSVNDDLYTIIGERVNGDNYRFAIHYGHLYICLWIDGSPIVHTGGEVIPNKWQMVAATYDGANLKLYINGLFDSSIPVTGTLDDNPSPLYIGNDWDSNDWIFHGIIDEIRIYNYASSPGDIQAYYLEGGWNDAEVGVVAHYPFNGDPYDIAGDNQPTVTSALMDAEDRFGNSASAYYFNGTDSYIEGPSNNFPTGQRSVSLWFKADRVDNFPTLFAYGGNTCGTSWVQGINQAGWGGYRVHSHCGVKDINQTYLNEPVNNWCHWVVTTSSEGTKMYVNGILINESPVYFSDTYPFDKEFAIGVGVYQDGTAPYIDGNMGYFNGYLDDIRVYNRPLSEAEVQELYHENGWATVTDIDGNIYSTVIIGEQEWMAENLRVTRYNNGDAIDNITDNATWETATTGAYGWYNNDYDTWGSTYGALYNWYTVTDSRNACPSGWHVPNQQEYNALYESLGSTALGGKLKEAGIEHWATPNTGATNSSGFTALPAGYRFSSGGFNALTTYNILWTTSEFDATSSYNFQLFYNSEDLWTGSSPKNYGNTIRCLKNNFTTTITAHYPLDGNADNLNGTNHGTSENFIPTTNRFGAENSALDFDGSNTVAIPNSSQFDFIYNDFSIGFWFTLDDINRAHNGLIGRNDFEGIAIEYNHDSDQRLYIFIDSDGVANWDLAWKPAYNSWQNNNWYNLTLVREYLWLKLYINGELVESLNTGNVLINNPATPLYLGRSQLSDRTHTGKLDDFTIYNRGLSSPEIEEIYRQGSWHQPDEGLVVYYPFNANSNDESGNGNTGLQYNGVNLANDRFANVNGAFTFDGGDDYILTPHSSSLDFTGELTVCAWINPAFNNISQQAISSKGGGWNRSGWMLSLNGNRVRWHIGNEATEGMFDTETEIPANSWSFIVARWKDGIMNVYVNGVKDNNYAEWASGLVENAYDHYIGKTDNVPFLFNGRIDDVRIYSRGLEEYEIEELFSMGEWDTMDVGLVANYLFNGTGLDNTGNGNDIIWGNPSSTNDRYGNANNAYQFNGIDNYAYGYATRYPTAERTISLWFNVNSLPGNSLPFSYGGNNCGESLLMFVKNTEYPNQYNVQGHCNVNSITADYPSDPIGQWVHYVVTTSASGTKLYINGILIGSNGNYINNTYVNGMEFYIGIGVNYYGTGIWDGFLDGKVDDIFVYNRELSQSEILKLYANFNAPQTLVAIPGNGEITLKWSSEGFDNISKYHIFQDGEYISTVLATLPSDTAVLIPDLNNHQIYQFYITSEDNYGNVSQPSYTVTKAPSATTVTDIDGNVYPTVVIGEQEWMAENLKTTRYNNNDQIATGLDNSTWSSVTYGAYAVAPYDQIIGLESEQEVIEAYGFLYNLHAAGSGFLCPTGWHLPDVTEWQELTDYLGGYSVAGGKLKSTRTDPEIHPRWDSPNQGATNESYFTGFPGGYRGTDGIYYNIGGFGGHWWSTEFSASEGYAYYLTSNTQDFSTFSTSKNTGFSIRCVKDDQGNFADLPYYQNFDSDLGDCMAYSVSGSTKGWVHNATYQVAQMNGYNSGEFEDDWLILPSVTLNNENYSLSFDSWRNYGSDDASNFFSLYYSTNYTGVGNPNDAVWTLMSYTQPAVDQAWTNSGNIDLSSITGERVFFAFRYNYNPGYYVLWEVDNIKIERPEFEGGSGTEEDPYQIAQAYQLNNVRNHLGAHFIQVADIDLGVAPWNEGEGWQPIGVYGYPEGPSGYFYGTYNGNGYGIYNLYINRPSEGYVGLFGSNYGINDQETVFKNIILQSVNITGGTNVGGIIGNTEYKSLIKNCFVTGSINGSNNVGGIAGVARSNAVISSNHFYGNVNGSSWAGGIVGENQGQIDNCYSRGNVTGTEFIGGLVGRTWTNITNCYSTANVTGSSYVGGLVGNVETSWNPTIVNSYWDIQTSGQSSSAAGEGRTTDDMTYPYAANTYIDWNFEVIWGEDPGYGINNGYPYLRRLDIELPTVTTVQVENYYVTSHTAKAGGEITSDGGIEISNRGIIWGYDANLSESSHIGIIYDEAVGSGTFDVILQPLSPQTSYYYRAFAINGLGWGYGDIYSFQTPAAMDYCQAIDNCNYSFTSEGSSTWFGQSVTGYFEGDAMQSGFVTDNQSTDLVTYVNGPGSLSFYWMVSTQFNSDFLQFLVNGSQIYAITSDGEGSWNQVVYDLPTGTHEIRWRYQKDAEGSNGQDCGWVDKLVFTPAGYSVVNTIPITSVTQSTATSGGNVTSDGGSSVTDKGIIWASWDNPMFESYEGYYSAGAGTGYYDGFLTSLSANTSYYVRAYAINGTGISYGEVMHFITLPSGPTVTDYDGNVYTYVTIGEQTWLAQNLNNTHYNNGDEVEFIVGNSSWINRWYGAWTYYNDNPIWESSYGKLYNWYVASDSRNICPVGWHVPTSDDWNVLNTYLGGQSVTGGKLKSTRTDLAYHPRWEGPNTGATNETGFTAYPGGYREGESIGFSESLGSATYWWGSTSDQPNHGYAAGVYSANADANWLLLHKSSGFSIRCIKDPSTPEVTTNYYENVGPYSANVVSEVTNDNGFTITGRGVVFSSTFENPTLANYEGIVYSGSGLGTFTSELTGLTPTTTYYVRAWASSDGGTGYGNQLTFTTNELGVYSVTFSLDMEDAIINDGGEYVNFNPEVYRVFISGNFDEGEFNWPQPGTNENLELFLSSASKDPKESLIYEVTLPVKEGNLEYKYFLVKTEPTWELGEWPGAPNRLIVASSNFTQQDSWGPFKANITTANPGQTVTFTAANFVNVSEWYWYFTSDSNPIESYSAGPVDVTFSTVGAKTISLRVYHVDNYYTFILNNYINVGNLPEISNVSESYIGYNDATIACTLKPNGFETTIRIEYGPTSALGNVVEDQGVYSEGSNSINFNLTSLEENKTYYYQIVATNDLGDVETEIYEFRTACSYTVTATTPSGSNNVCAGQTETYTTTSPNAETYVWEISPSNAGTFSSNTNSVDVLWAASFSGSASIRVRGISGDCNSQWSSYLNVYVNLTQSDIVISGEQQVCSGSDVMYTLSRTATNYNWQVDGGTVLSSTNRGVMVRWNTLGSGNVRIIEQGASACPLISNYSTTISTSTVPSKPEIHRKGSINILICKTPNMNYKWFFNDQILSSQTAQYYVARNNLGAYNVQIRTGSSGCPNTSNAYNLNVLATMESMLHVYPNPASDEFNVEVESETLGEARLIITNGFGKVVHQQTFEKTDYVLQQNVKLQHLPQGLYIVTLQVGNDEPLNSKLTIY